MSNLYLQIQEDMKNAMRAKAVFELGTVRLLLAAIKQREIDERIKLDDTQIIGVIDKMIKQRNESIKQYQQGNRQDLVDKENAEIKVLEKYLPQKLSDTETLDLVKEAIKEIGGSSIKDMAKVMTYVRNKAQGRVNMENISSIVKQLLQ